VEFTLPHIRVSGSSALSVLEWRVVSLVLLEGLVLISSGGTTFLIAGIFIVARLLR
jgi:hypothetical protein